MKWPKTIIVVSHARDFLNTVYMCPFYHLIVWRIFVNLYPAGCVETISEMSHLKFPVSAGGHGYSSLTRAETDFF